MGQHARATALLLAAVLLGTAAPARAIIVYGDGDSGLGRNLLAPTGNLAGSGWDTVGRWQGGGGVAIAPNYFLTAHHINASVGNTFTLGGQNYTSIGFTDIAGTDLRVVEVSGTFTSYASLYTKNDEMDKDLVAFGYGTTRDAEVVVDGTLKGWSWGTVDGQKSWGTGTVGDIGAVGGSAYPGDMIGFAFDGSGPNNGIYSNNDSGGGVFIQDGGVWKLAGINYLVNNEAYKYDATTGKYVKLSPVAIFDTTNLFYKDDQGAYQPWDGPFASYATRVSTYSSQVLAAVPEPGSLVLLGAGGLIGVVMVSRRRRRGAGG